MDWDTIFNSVLTVARKTLTLAFALVLVMAAFGFVYIGALTLLWIIRHAQAALGS